MILKLTCFLGVFKTKQTKRSSFKLGETGERYQLFLTLEPWDCALRQSSSSISSGSLSNRPIWSSSLLRCFNLVGTSELKSLWKIWRHDHDWSPSPSYSNDVCDSLFFCLFRPTFFVVEGDNTRPVNMDYCNFWHSIGAYSTAAILYSVYIAIYSPLVGISGNKPLPEFPHFFCWPHSGPLCVLDL